MANPPVRTIGGVKVFALSTDRDRPPSSYGDVWDQWDNGELTYVLGTGILEMWEDGVWLNVSSGLAATGPEGPEGPPGPGIVVLEALDPDPDPGDHPDGTLVFRKLV